jgi:hypothetical protein
MIYIKFFPKYEIFLGFRITEATKLDSFNFNPEKEYPTHYVVEVGLLFVTFTWRSS